MNVTGGSDLSRLHALQKQAIATRNNLDKAGGEMSTGLKASPYEAANGNLTRLFSLERSLDRNAVFRETISLTELRLDVMQQGLGRMLEPAAKISLDLATALGKNDIPSARQSAREARAAFADTVGVLNGRVAGQALFAGTATDRTALAPADAILAELDALAAATTTAADAVAAIDEYFRKDPAPSGAFFTSGYVGSTDDLAAVEIGENSRLDFSMRADKDEFVALLRAQAKAAVVANGSFGGDPFEQMALLNRAATAMLDAKEGILSVRNLVGVSQFAVESARAQRVSEQDTLALARANIVAVDPLEAASTFQTLQIQLESVYAVTARLAQLSFTNYMR